METNISHGKTFVLDIIINWVVSESQDQFNRLLILIGWWDRSDSIEYGGVPKLELFSTESAQSTAGEKG